MVLAAGVLGLVAGQSARAAQPPMSQKEMEENSDAVAVVDVLGVVCERLESGGGWYTAWVQVKEVIEGDLQVNNTFITHFAARPQTGGRERGAAPRRKSAGLPKQ